MTLSPLRRCARPFTLLVLGVGLSLLSACASDNNGAITTTRSGALPSDTAAPTSAAGTPMMSTGTGSSMGSNGLGGSRGSF